jgi:hypothetical protein
MKNSALPQPKIGGMANCRDTTAICELTGEPVSTWSEERRMETEARAVLAMSKEERNVFFNGRMDENRKSIDRARWGSTARSGRGGYGDDAEVAVSAEQAELVRAHLCLLALRADCGGSGCSRASYDKFRVQPSDLDTTDNGAACQTRGLGNVLGHSLFVSHASDRGD